VGLGNQVPQRALKILKRVFTHTALCLSDEPDLGQTRSKWKRLFRTQRNSPERSNYAPSKKGNDKMKKEKKREFVVEFRETRTVMKSKVIKARSQFEADEIAEIKYGHEYCDDGLGNARAALETSSQPMSGHAAVRLGLR
jgi:hypothetical protein